MKAYSFSKIKSQNNEDTLLVFNRNLVVDSFEGIVAFEIDMSQVFDLSNENHFLSLSEKFPEVLNLPLTDDKLIDYTDSASVETLKSYVTSLGYSGLLLSSPSSRILSTSDYSILQILEDVDCVENYVENIETIVTLQNFIDAAKLEEFKIDFQSILNSYNYSDHQIKVAIESGLTTEKMADSWGADWSKNTTQTKEEWQDFHLQRIAKLAISFQNGAKVEPLTLRIVEGSSNYLTDGNHRIRALIYLQRTSFPAIISGNQVLIEKFLGKK